MSEQPVHTKQSLYEEARLLVRPFYWMSDERDAKSYKGGASFFAIRSDKKLFGVTAKHAKDNFLKDTVIGTVPRLNNHRYDPSDKIISEKRDICTFSLTGYDANKMGIVPLRWPPLTPWQDRGVVIAGYMCAKSRVEIDDGKITFDKLCNLLVATRVKSDLIEVEIDARVLEMPKVWADLTEIPNGFSGCPLLTVTQDKRHPFAAGGVVTNFVPIDSKRGYFEARPLLPYLQDDGSLR